ncbi:MAG TPA: carboxypeptidase regulatory-like domain-containing protein, partial [Terriglobia bacterium]|nr:carboxypeptidase regulatory-like domain-containing protein [Terriglobia bacterium]
MKVKAVILWTLTLAFLALAAAPRVALAQDAGTITGTVTDPSGGAIPNATVTITDTGTGVTARTLKTNGLGLYVASSLLIGTYSVSVQATGFQQTVRSGIVLHVADRLAVNFALKLGAVAQSVQVNGAPALVQTQTGEENQVISTQQMTQLPVLGRNFFELQQVVPGAIKTGADENGKGFYSTKSYSINGFNSNYTGYQLDGVQNTDMGNQNGTMTNPGPDALAEFKVLTSNYSAKYGTAGGAELLAVTKSGTKQFHGDAYDFVRNDAFDAADFFLNKNSQKKAPLRYNDYGYTIGGPFYIPGHYNTDKTKTFFFWDQEWIKESTLAPIVAATPTAAMRSGDFTSVGPLTNPMDPRTGAPLLSPSGAPCVSGAQINPACINPNVALLFQQDFPEPNAPGFFNFIQGAHTGQNWREEIIRVDQNITDKVKVFVRYINDSWHETDPVTQWSGDAFPTVHSTFNIPSRNFIAHVSTILSPTLLNEISYNYASNYPSSSTPAMLILGATQKPAGYTAQNVFGQNYYNFIPDMSFSQGYGGISTLWGPWWAHHNISQASDDLTKEIGSHSLQMGVTTMFSITPVQSQTSPSSQGKYSFDGHFTGNAIADALLGLPESYSELEGRREPYYNFHQTEAYFEDDWKVNQQLTLNLGVRYFAIPHVYGKDLSMFLASKYDPGQSPTVTPSGSIVPNSGNLLNGIIISGKNGTPMGLVHDHWNTIAPRFGFAWDINGTSRTVLRGGYGIGYYRIEGNDVYGMVGNPPFSKLATFFTPPFDNPAAGVAAPLTPLAINGLDPIYDIPMVQSWSLNVQRQLTPNLMFSAAYVGSRGTHLDYTRDINQPFSASGYDFDPRIACTSTTPVPCASRVSTDYVRPFAGWSGINNVTPVGKSTYHALQVTLNKRVSHGLTFGVAYTYSKTLGLSGANGLGSGPQNSYNLAAEYGPASFSRTNVLVINYVYDLPFFHSFTGLPGAVLKGWEFTGIGTIESGFPLTAGLTSPTQGLATRPDFVSGQQISGPQTVAEWFNAGAYATPPFGTFGNAGVGTIWGPGMNEWDMGFFKNFKMGERANLQFRAESFNLWNTTNFDS